MYSYVYAHMDNTRNIHVLMLGYIAVPLQAISAVEKGHKQYSEKYTKQLRVRV